MNQSILRIKQAVILTVLTMVVLFFVISTAHAEELVISGNGSGSDSQVQVSLNATTTVEQSNQANVTNDVNVSADTGQNSTSGNTISEVNLNTGNISADTSILNSVNTSNVNLNCCPSQPDLNINVSGNGTNSQNLVDVNLTSDTNINIYQDAYISNSVNGSANTGTNSANNNTGADISIATGNINVSNEINNTGINNSTVSAPQGGFDLALKISGNGSGSKNLVRLSLSDILQINLNNISAILNSSNWVLNTGGNSANGNAGGSVSIVTGDINVNTKIANDGINSNEVISACCDSIYDPGDDPFDPADPADPAGGPIQPALPSSQSNSSPLSSNPSSSSSSSGQVLAQAIAAAGQILPATGSLWTIMLTLAALVMFILGLYLRQHPGRDPSLRYV